MIVADVGSELSYAPIKNCLLVSAIVKVLSVDSSAFLIHKFHGDTEKDTNKTKIDEL